jgi:phosphonate transport system substrate-binding protein
VLVGDYDAGSIKEGTFKKYNEDGELRILRSFDNVTKPWIAKVGMPEPVFAALKKSLINLRDPDVMKALNVSGFSACEDTDYQMVREGMELSHQFGPDEVSLGIDNVMADRHQDAEPTAQAAE